MNHLVQVFIEILYLGGISSFLIILILLIKKMFNKVLSPRWHYYIWVLLLVRLLIPYTPESLLSILNLFNTITEEANLLVNNMGSSNLNNSGNAIIMDTAMSQASVIVKNTSNNGTQDTNVAQSFNNIRPTERMPVMMIITLLWLSGVLFISLFTIYINIVFAMRINKNYKILKDPRINRILDECKKIAGVKRDITLLTSQIARTPSLYVSRHTKILVSETYMEQLKDQEIKYIFLHELSHYKNKDITVNWVLTLLRIVYFFNPLIWYAFYKIHVDCEIFCDAEALKYLKEEDYQGYGSTVIKLIKLYSESNFIPATAGLWKHKSNYRRRIIMISKYKRSNWLSTLLTIILILIIGIIGLTGCKKSDVDTSSTENISATTEDAEQSAEVDIPTPEITETPVNSEDAEQSNLTQLVGLLGLSKDELINNLSEEYNKVDEGGLEFIHQGIRVWFDEKSITNQVYTDKSNIDFNSVKIGDSIDNFKDVFGDIIIDNNGDAIFKYNSYYLSVYYDTSTKKTYAVYILTEDAVELAEEDEVSAEDPSQSDTVSGEVFFGDWVIKHVLAYGTSGTYSKEDAESMVGKSMSFSADSATCFGDEPSYIEKTAKNPEYLRSDITSGDFVENYRMTFDKLGITTDSVTEITVSDAEGNGSIFFIKNDNTLIVNGGGTYFELVRKK